jgi:hypothetical protein
MRKRSSAMASGTHRLEKSSPVEDEVEKDDGEPRRADEQRGRELEVWDLVRLAW